MVVSTIEEACEEAADAAEEMEDDEFVASYFFVEDTHIGTGSQCVDGEESHCIFEFKKEPEHPWFASNVAAMAFFLETDKDDEDDMIELLEELEEELERSDFTMEEIEAILENVEEMSCECGSDSDSSTDGGSSGSEVTADSGSSSSSSSESDDVENIHGHVN